MMAFVFLTIGILYVAAISPGFRMFCFAVGAIIAGCIAFLADFGSDKPQTFFYMSQSHPAFLMKAGSVCPSDRHVWNNWCVK
jgi:hypothetical protein